MKYWDGSAVLPLLMAEPASAALRRVAESDGAMVVWWGTRIECVSALARRARENRLNAASVTRARQLLAALTANWSEVQPSDDLRLSAQRIVTVHSLRAADAMQLAGALAACRGATGNLPFVSLDTRLREAADREGFTVLPEHAGPLTGVRERPPRKQSTRRRGART